MLILKKNEIGNVNFYKRTIIAYLIMGQLLVVQHFERQLEAADRAGTLLPVGNKLSMTFAPSCAELQ